MSRPCPLPLALVLVLLSVSAAPTATAQVTGSPDAHSSEQNSHVNPCTNETPRPEGCLSPEPAPLTEASAPLTLSEALALAAEYSETPAIAEARVARAQALRRQAVAALLPSLTFAGTYTRRAREVTREIDGDVVTVQALDALASQAFAETTLFDLRALPLLRAASRGVDAQRLESFELRRALAHDVATGFFVALGAEKLLEASRERVRVAQATFDEARLRVEAGLAGRNDATRTELELASARLAETRAANNVVTTRLSLSYLVGAPVEDRELAEPDDPELPAGDRDELVSRAYAARAELVALGERAAQARQLALAPRYGILPRLDARGLFRTTNESGLSGREEDWNLSVGLTWELWDGGDRRAVAAQRDAEALELELELERRRREVALEVADGLATVAGAEAAVEQASVRQEVARANATEIRERFQNGLASALEQADASVEQFEAEAELVRQRYTRALAKLALTRALGLWPEGAQAPAQVTGSPEARPNERHGHLNPCTNEAPRPGGCLSPELTQVTGSPEVRPNERHGHLNPCTNAPPQPAGCLSPEPVAVTEKGRAE